MIKKQTSKKTKAITSKPLLPAVASPLTATSNAKVCRLKTDNHATKDYWIITDGWNVTICKQRSGESAVESMTIPLKDFNRLIKWYVKPQNVQGNDH